MTDTILVEYDLPHAPAKVWRALTEPALLEAWLMKNDIRAEVGHRFTMKAQPMPGWDGTVRCEVLEVDAPRRLVYTWVGGNETHRLDTVVKWTLTPTPSGTRLLLEHSGFLPDNAFAFDALARGWRGKVAERISEALASAG
jgi:uncharacterized protein YndB with AHSA1/START domain